MSKTVAHAPLVELIAELRWQPHIDDGNSSTLPVHGGAVTMMPTGSTKLEEFLMRFGAKASQEGFSRTERLQPPGLPCILHLPIYRFKTPDESPVVYQIGGGVFTTNGVPPYVSWEKFCPLVEKGVEALLLSREDDKSENFFSVSVRYIDAFGPELTRDLNPATFIQEMLGFQITLPPGISNYLAEGETFKPALRFQIPMAGSMLMTVSVGEGQANGQGAIILDTTVTTTTDTLGTKDAVMESLNAAQNALHDMFFEITKPLKSQMGVTENTQG